MDTIYILTPDSDSAWQLAEIAGEWAGAVRVFDDPNSAQSALGGTQGKQAVVTV